MSHPARPSGPPVEIFCTHSSIEAEVVRGLLDAHDIESALGSPLSPSVFPIGFGQAVFRISVPAGLANKARDLISSHLDEAAAAELRRLSETLGPLEDEIDYRFRDLGLLEHALTHRSRAHEDASGGVIDNDPTFRIYSVAAGRVVSVLWDDLLGNTVVIEHKAPNGDLYRSSYMHMRDGFNHDLQKAQAIDGGEKYDDSGKVRRVYKYSLFAHKDDPSTLHWGTNQQTIQVTVGDTVQAGEFLGWSGNTGSIARRARAPCPISRRLEEPNRPTSPTE